MTIQNDKFSNFIFLSSVLHLSVFILFTVKILIFPDKIPSYRQSIRVDIVALPEKETPSVKKIESIKKVQIKKQSKKSEKIKSLKLKKNRISSKEEKNLKEEQKSAIARLKALKHLENRRKTKELKYKGNIVSKGFSLKGLEELHHKSYLERLDHHIRKYWNLPEWLDSANLNTHVLIRIDRNGNILSKNLVLGSGNEFFDQNVFKTLEKASPLSSSTGEVGWFLFYKGSGVSVSGIESHCDVMCFPWVFLF